MDFSERLRRCLEEEQKLERGFYARSAVAVAREVIGQILVCRRAGRRLAGRIVEAEAYRGPSDLAAHSRGGLRTPRTEAMFGPPGHAYVFLVYGMHYQFNLVTARKGAPEAVLIRALEPLDGQTLMARRRGFPPDGVELTNGPGKLCRALGIDLSDYGKDLCADELYLVRGCKRAKVEQSPRIGVAYAGAWANKPWRFFERGNAYVSVRTPSGRP